MIIMKDYHDSIYEIVKNVYDGGVKPLIIEKESYAYIKDPVFDIKRNRVVAEILKAIVRLDLEKNEKKIEKLCNYLKKNQNKDGSLNEIHPNYDQPSALITSIVGEALLITYGKYPNDALKKSIQHAKDFVLSMEKTSGYFIKSKQYTADHLNVDATCGAFLASYGKSFSDGVCINAAENAARNVCKFQFSDGSYPYAASKGSYSHLLNVPCVHYQGVTMYYLSKINEIVRKNWLKDSLIHGAEWLSIAQNDDGWFDWSKSGLMFAYYLSGAYAFAFSSFFYVSQWSKKYGENAEICIDALKENTGKLCLRWEKDSWISFPLSVPIALKTAVIGNYPLKHKLFRFGYGLYRQMARRRYSTSIDDKLFRNLTNVLNLETSTIEPFNNYPDLFMTSEVLDCLSSVGGN